MHPKGTRPRGAYFFAKKAPYLHMCAIFMYYLYKCRKNDINEKNKRPLTNRGLFILFQISLKCRGEVPSGELS
jgi:hypothetical protein